MFNILCFFSVIEMLFTGKEKAFNINHKLLSYFYTHEIIWTRICWVNRIQNDIGFSETPRIFQIASLFSKQPIYTRII